MKNIIEITNLNYRYPDEKRYVLKDINLKIPENTFTALIGHSGCGKTTLLMLIRGFFNEFGGELSGKIKIIGKDIRDVDVSKLGKDIGIIFQDPQTQLHQLHVIDEVASAPMYQGLPYDECQKRAKDLIDKVLDLSFYSKAPNELSSGQQQKVALAATLAMDCKIILLDEPFSFLDTYAKKEILDILIELKKQGKTIIFSTHDIESISSITDTMVLMEKGKVLAIGKPLDVLYNDEFEKALLPPLSIRCAKNLIKIKKLEKKVLDWNGLLKEYNPKEKIKNNEKENIKNKLIVLENASYTYPESDRGIKNISLNIYKNEIIGLIGSNGSGKTTLAKILLGLIKVTKGNVTINGNRLNKLRQVDKAKLIGYATQDPIDMFFEDTVLNECAFGPKCLKLENPEKISLDTLEKLSLSLYKDKHPDSLSGGEKSLLGIGCVLANDPKIIILDEPEFGLDPKNWQKIAKIIKELQVQGKTIIIITQDLEKSMFLCDRIILMSKGEIIKAGPPKEILNDETLKKTVLSSLPIFRLLPYLSQDALHSEDEFIQEVKRIW